MATLNYRDPATGQWVAIPVYAGAVGPPGPPGEPGPVVISTVTGNTASFGTDGQLFVSDTGALDSATASTLYVDVVGDAMTGELFVPDQVVTNPVDPTVAAARGYVDQMVIVSATGPAVAPMRDGQKWFVVGEPSPRPVPPTGFTGTLTDATTNTLSWIDSTVATKATDTTARYEIRYNLTGVPVTGADMLLVAGVPAGVQTFTHTKDAAAQAAGVIGYGIKAVNDGGSSAWVLTSVSNGTPTTTTLVTDASNVYVGDSFTVTADTTADAGSVQFKIDGVAFTQPVPVDAAGVATITENLHPAGTYVYTAEYLPVTGWAGSVSNEVTVTATLKPTTTSIVLLDQSPTIGSTIVLYGITDGVEGSIQFMKNGAAFGAPVVIDLNGLAYIQPTVDDGSTTWVADYSGDSASAPSTSSPLVVVGELATSSTYLTVPNGMINTAITCTASVTAAGVTLSAGTVQFKVGSTNIGGPVSFNGTNYTVTWTPTTTGTHTLTATYSGDVDHSPSSDSDTSSIDRPDLTTTIYIDSWWPEDATIQAGQYPNVWYHVVASDGSPGKGVVKSYMTFEGNAWIGYTLDANGYGESNQFRITHSDPEGPTAIHCDFRPEAGSGQLASSTTIPFTVI